MILTRRSIEQAKTVDAAGAARNRLTAALLIEDPTPKFWTMVEDGFFERWIPEVIEMQMEQDPIHHHKDVLAHTFAVVRSSPPELRVRFAALMHDIGKPATRQFGPGGVTFRHHETVGARITLQRLSEMGFDDLLTNQVAKLVGLSGRFKGFGDSWTDSAVRRYAVDAGELLGDLNLLVRADCTTRNRQKVRAIQAKVDRLEQRIRELARSDAEARRKPVLSGAEIMEILNIPPGPSVGAAIEMLLSDVHSGDRDAAESLLRSWWSERETAIHNA